MKKVIAAGHICLDITPVFCGEKAERAEDILLPGKLIQMGKADVHTGGSVANTGLAMKFLGADVRLMGKVGVDEFGTIVKKILAGYDAQKDLLEVEGDSTSYSVILAIPGIDRIILHNPGANDTFSADDIPEDAWEGCALFHFGYPTIMKKMYQGCGEELNRILKRAKDSGAATSLDLSMVDSDSEAGKADWAGIIENVLPYVDFFVPSVEELCFMLDKERFLNWQERAGKRDITEVLDIDGDIKPLADKCMVMGAKVLFLKCGAAGIYYRTAGGENLKDVGIGAGLDIPAWENLEGFETSYVPEKVLSGNGAGDTSIAAFLTAMLQGYPPEWCVRLAAAEGASCVEAYDALSGLKSLEALEEKIRQGWKKYGG